MFCKVRIKERDYSCYYETYGDTNNPPLVLLHGWGVDSSIFKNVIPHLNYYCILIDFIGFGKSDEPDYPWTIYDYVESIKILIDELKIKRIKKG